MKPINVALVDVGEMSSVSLKLLARRLNRVQSVFRFEESSAITTAFIGDPQIDGQWYDTRILLKHIRAHPRAKNFDLLVGVTLFRITNPSDRYARSQRDYFSASDLTKGSIVTINPNVEHHKSSSKSTYQYVSYLAMCELMCSLSKTYLPHVKLEGCLFDECDDRKMLAVGMDKALICSDCIKRLEDGNINRVMREQILRVLKWCSKNTWRFAVVATAKDTFTALSLALGAGLSWLVSEFIEKTAGLYVFLFFLLPPLAIFGYYKFFHKVRFNED